MRKLATIINRQLSGKKLGAFTDSILLAATAYLVIRRLTGFSLSDYLTDKGLLGHSGIAVYFAAGLTLLVFAFTVRLLKTALCFVPIDLYEQVRPDEITASLVRINEESNRHIESAATESRIDPTRLPDAHAFGVNVRMIISELATHIRGAITGCTVRNKDLLISLYEVQEGDWSAGEVTELQYVAHWHPNRDDLDSQSISRISEKHRDYVCWSCIDSKHKTVPLYKCNWKSSSRHKTIKHYIGLKLTCLNNTVGFLNIEFHNRQCFGSEGDLKTFIENNMMAFHTLLEYQFLKRIFFRQLADELRTEA